MSEVFGLAFGEMAGFLCFFAVGVLLGRFNLLPQQAGATLSRLITYVFLPAMMFNSFALQCTVEKLSAYARLLLAGVLLLCICVGVSLLVRRKFRGDRIESITAAYSMVVPNFGYLGYPLVLALFGQEALTKFMMFGLPFQLYIYVYAMKQWMPETGTSSHAILRVLNAPIVALFLGMALGLSGLPYSSGFLASISQSAANCMSPCAMIATGLALGQISFRRLLGDARIYWIAFLRLIALPAVIVIATYFLCKAFRLDPDILRISGVFLALPLGINPVVFAQAYGHDGSFAASCALISMVISLLTLPALIEFVTRLALLL